MIAPQPALGAVPPAVASSLDGNVARRRAAHLAVRCRLNHRTRGGSLPKTERRRIPGHVGPSGRERHFARRGRTIARCVSDSLGTDLETETGRHGLGETDAAWPGFLGRSL